LFIIQSKSELPCPGNPKECKRNKTRKNTYLLNSPTYLTFNLIWRETRPLLVDILKVFLMIPQRLSKDDLFEDDTNKVYSNYELYGMICFWGAHYIAYYKSNEKDEHWIYFDDTIVSKVENWKDVIIKCIKSHFHPTILLYRKVDNKFNLKADDDELTKEELNKWMAFCQKYDNERETEDKIEPVGRLRPTSDSKKRLNFQDITLPKNTDEKQAELIRDYVATENSNQTPRERVEKNSNYYQNSKEITKSEMIEKQQKESNTQKDIKISSDEWICDVKFCNTVNKIENATCSKCKIINENIRDMIIQKQVLTSGYDEALNKKFKTKIGESATKRNIQELKELKCHECEYCMKDNYYNAKNCENCYTFNDKNSGKTLNRSIKHKENYLDYPFYWTCAFCKKLNKEYLITCDLCRKNKIIYVDNPEEVKLIEQKYKAHFDKLHMNTTNLFCKKCNDQYACPGSLFCELCNLKRGVSANPNSRSVVRENRGEVKPIKDVNSVMEKIKQDLRRSGLGRRDTEDYAKENQKTNWQNAQYVNLPDSRVYRHPNEPKERVQFDDRTGKVSQSSLLKRDSLNLYPSRVSVNNMSIGTPKNNPNNYNIRNPHGILFLYIDSVNFGTFKNINTSNQPISMKQEHVFDRFNTYNEFPNKANVNIPINPKPNVNLDRNSQQSFLRTSNQQVKSNILIRSYSRESFNRNTHK
jgi:hypothetical protein